MDKDKFLEEILHDIKKMSPMYESINKQIAKTSGHCATRKEYRKLEYAYLALMLRIDRELKEGNE